VLFHEPEAAARAPHGPSAGRDVARRRTPAGAGARAAGHQGVPAGTIEELESANEELKSSNEELQSSNEELQSTNEELETSKEELQSSNEE
jgi:predicted RNase H-like nuclease (RuvC/YqgF family)